MILCKHDNYKVIDHILEPKYSTQEILISTDAISPNIEHYLIRFSKPAPQEKYGWFYMSGKTIRRHKKQKNGRGEVYVVPLSKREEFIPNKTCEHEM